MIVFFILLVSYNSSSSSSSSSSLLTLYKSVNISLKDGVKELGLKIFDNSIYEVKNPNILLAGCGTGQHAISSASRFQNSHGSMRPL